MYTLQCRLDRKYLFNMLGWLYRAKLQYLRGGILFSIFRLIRMYHLYISKC